MWNETINIQITSSNENLINCLVFDDPVTTPWQFTFVYGPPTPGLRPAFWDSLPALGNAFPGLWHLTGDFNALLSQEDKRGGRAVGGPSTGGLRGFVNQFGFIDLGFHGHPFTWSNRRSGAHNIQERLNRSLVNAQWKPLHPHASLLHLTAIHSNHKPLLLNTNPGSHNLPKPFRFEAMWLEHPDTSYIIQAALQKGHSLATKLKNTKVALRKWNKTVFGHISQKTTALRNLVEDLQNGPQDAASISQEQQAVIDLMELEKQEAIFWKERSKVRWVEEGDLNTHYFHVSTVIHRRYNHITYILNSENHWINDRQLIGGEFEAFFKGLYATVFPIFPADMQELILPVITPRMNAELTACPLPSEVHQTLFAMGTYKSPGPDGMTVVFYKQYWSIIHETVVREVQDFFVMADSNLLLTTPSSP